METTLHDFVISGLQKRKSTWPAIARETGVPYPTIGKIARREIKDPGVTSVETLARHLRLLDRQEVERMQGAAVGAGR
jgi:hypothetical protein